MHLDAAEADTDAGRQATRFVRRKLAKAATVVVKTARLTDAHGRFLAYCFYSDRALDADAVFRGGRYLNGELVQAGLATVPLDHHAR